MSASGPFSTEIELARIMSGLNDHTADITDCQPGAIKRRHGLFDDLIGAAEKGERDADTNGLGRLEVHDELDSGGLLHRQIGQLSALAPFAN